MEKIKTITTAIVYPNNKIHLGWAWETLGADWLSRASKLMGEKTFFVTGMDEHSIKVQKRAEDQGLSPKAFCDQMASDIQKTLAQLQISYDRFIRTSDTDHYQVVQSLVQKAFDKGDIYKAKYEGHYCEGCEAFYLDKDLVEGLCVHHKTKPKWISEENYFFRLSKYQASIVELLKIKPEFLQPDHRRVEILNFIEQGLKDFSISRSNFTWGIPLPFESSHVVYVWFDALINYLTACGYLESSQDFKSKWPAAVHIIGKDITRFHAVFWPAMLMSLELPLPEKIFVHGFLNIKGDRMSKSSGNIVTPDEVIAKTGSDALRYFLLADNVFEGDGNFSLELMALKCNADLSNDLGNLVNRTLNMTRKYFPNEVIAAPVLTELSKELRDSFATLKEELQKTIEEIRPQAYAQTCLARSRVLNLFIDRTKPWALAKAQTEQSLKDLREVLYVLMEGIRIIAHALQPLMPIKTKEIETQLGMQKKGEGFGFGATHFAPIEPQPIFPRIELVTETSENA